jgi:hypothetical protein
VSEGVGSISRMIPRSPRSSLLIARVVFQRWSVSSFFISIALPLTIALALIRLLVRDA